MILTVVYCLLGAVIFVEQEVPGIRVGPVKPFTGQTAVNYRHADLDGDGATDLLFPAEILFQREGRFPPGLRLALPHIEESPTIDTWDGEVYFKHHHRLRVSRWDGEVWITTLDQEMLWPGESEDATATAPSRPAREAAPKLERFLYDLDGDGTPEIIVPYAAGIRIYHKEQDRYVPSEPMAIFPPPKLVPGPVPALWPSSARRLSLPTRQMACRFFLDGTRVTLLVGEDAPEGKIGYRSTVYRLEQNNGWSLQSGETEESISKPLPPHLLPCRLNDDDVIDYAGGRWENSSASALAIPIYETWATLDAGKSFQVRRVPTIQRFRPRCSFVDFDGDGDMDMITESTDMFDAGIREALSRRLTHRTIEHKLQIYRQVQGRFTARPELEKRFKIQLREPPFKQGPIFQRYLASELFDITGDFNGDGYRDVVVQARPGVLEVYLAAGFGFPKEPDVTIDLRGEANFGIADVNNDGRSDIVLSAPGTAPPGIGPNVESWDRTRILFAEETLP